MRECATCGQMKDETEFFVKRRNKNGSANLCSECKVCHSKREMDRYYAKQDFIDSYKTRCAKCGESRIRCISFHHTDPAQKEFTIGKIRKSSFDTIISEINKCICLCLNCHHEFHYLNSSQGISIEEYLADRHIASSYKGSTLDFESRSCGSLPHGAAI